MNNRSIKNLINEMTLEEKLSILTGKDGFNTVNIDRLSIPSLRFLDGPHGLRESIIDSKGRVHESTCFPTSSAMAATFNVSLVEEIGEAIGKECILHGVDVLLAPGANTKRSPLCGRNFEYFSEDSELSGSLASAYIKGVQKTGVAVSLKHFAANNSENHRMDQSSDVDERTLREIYLRPFEIAVKTSSPKTIMTAYNRINGIFCSENFWLLNDILRKEWGYDGVVISDWGGVHNRSEALKATLELAMPGPYIIWNNQLKASLESGDISIDLVDQMVERLLILIFDIKEFAKPVLNDNIANEHNILAQRAATEAITLLENDGILPLDSNKLENISVIGRFSDIPNIQGDGSSRVPISSLLSKPVDAIQNELGENTRLNYYDISPQQSVMSFDYFTRICQESAKADVAILIVGTPINGEGEGFNRANLDLPQNDMLLLQLLLNANIPTILVVLSGAPVVLPALRNRPNAILQGWFLGQGLGKALSDILFGKVSPSGRLPITFPKRMEDTPNYQDLTGNELKEKYCEGVFVGYRHYDALGITPLYPFGYGLSYTEFEYSCLALSNNVLSADERVSVNFLVKNIGKIASKEVCQLYIKIPDGHIFRPVREFKRFTKIYLEPNESKQVQLELDYRDFCCYNVQLKDWYTESGHFFIDIGASSRDIRLSQPINVISNYKFS